MSNTNERGDGDSSIFTNESEREQALLAMAVESDHDTDAARAEYERLLTENENGEQVLYLGARRAGWNPCGCEDVECEHTLAALGLTESDTSGRENVSPDPLDGFDDPAFLPDGSGRENATGEDPEEYPTGGRSGYERRQREIERGEHEPPASPGSPERVNMSAVPGTVRRNYDDRSTEDPEEYPGGDRRSWERRQLDVDDIPSDDPEPPAGTREEYKQRRENTAYPLTAKRRRERREARRAARERRKEAARRADRRRRMDRGERA